MAQQSLFDLALAAEGISGPLADVARSVYYQESRNGRNAKTSNAGAVGGMQIIPPTFASVADKGWDINNDEHNLRAGLRYLKKMDKAAGGDPFLTAVGYYGGPGAIPKAKNGQGVSDPRNPNAPDTIRYAQQVVGRLPSSSSGEPVVSPVAPVAVQEKPIDQPVQVAQAPVQVGYVAPDTGGWKEFQQAMPEPITPVALNFGSVDRNFNPLAYGPQSDSINFRPFMARKGRA